MIRRLDDQAAYGKECLLGRKAHRSDIINCVCNRNLDKAYDDIMTSYGLDTSNFVPLHFGLNLSEGLTGNKVVVIR